MLSYALTVTDRTPVTSAAVRRTVCPLLIAVLSLLAACGKGRDGLPAPAAPPAGPAAGAPPAPAPSPAAAAPVVVFLGDSLTAGLGLPVDQAYPALVAGELAARGRQVRVVNAGVSGDTTAGGLRRVDWVLTQRPAVLVLALGANDGLRGLPLGETERNLREIVVRATASGSRVVLCGMLIPTNYGPEYQTGFGKLFFRLARELPVEHVPFLLEGVAGVPELNLEDGVHPNAEGQKLLARNVLPAVLAALDAGQKPR